MAAPIVAALIRAFATSQGAIAAGRSAVAARTAAGSRAAVAGGGQANFAAKDLFKRAFAPGGMADPTQLANQQNEDANREKDNQQKAEASERMKDLSKAAFKGAAAFALLPPATVAFSRALLASQESMRQFSSKTAQAFVELEGGRFAREAGKAKGTENTTAQLAEQLGKLEATLAPYMSLLANALNILASAGIQAINILISAMEKLPGVGNAVKVYREELEAKGREGAAEAFGALDRLGKSAGELQRPLLPPKAPTVLWNEDAADFFKR